MIALGTYEIQNQNQIELDYIFNNEIFKYIDTAINYNCDYILSKYLYKGFKLISKISPCHNEKYEFFIKNHLKCLKKDKIDIMLIHSDRGDWKSLLKKMINDDRFIEIGVSNFTIEEIIEFKKIAGRYPAYNEMEVNPFYMDKPQIEFCKENDIKIIGYEIFGGKYLSEKFTTIYGINNLISNAKKYCDIIIIKPTSIYQMDVIKNVLSNNNLNSVDIPFLDKEKIMQPMIFNPEERLDKLYKNIAIYSNMCVNKNLSLILECEMENKFEFLCDYMVELRYNIGSNTYIGDFLLDNNNYYLVQIFDTNNNLTKVTTGKEKVKVLVFKEEN